MGDLRFHHPHLPPVVFLRKQVPFDSAFPCGVNEMRNVQCGLISSTLTTGSKDRDEQILPHICRFKINDANPTLVATS